MFYLETHFAVIGLEQKLYLIYSFGSPVDCVGDVPD